MTFKISPFRTISNFSAGTTMAVLTALLGLSLVMENLVVEEDDSTTAALSNYGSSQNTDWMHE